MDALKGHSNGTIPGCQKREEPTHTQKGMEFLRAQFGRLLALKNSERAYMPGMRSINTIMVVVVRK